ncbi:MAG: hypothetical protein PHV68_06875 [Candidatus Gastranaerophilales bacterium]|nr:hypothetical protein [Candidatus Gastranaerophilales bacterium]
MAKIIENSIGRRMVKLSANDVFMVISQFQLKSSSKKISKEDLRRILDAEGVYLPEDC